MDWERAVQTIILGICQICEGCNEKYLTEEMHDDDYLWGTSSIWMMMWSKEVSVFGSMRRFGLWLFCDYLWGTSSIFNMDDDVVIERGFGLRVDEEMMIRIVAVLWHANNTKTRRLRARRAGIDKYVVLRESHFSHTFFSHDRLKHWRCHDKLQLQCSGWLMMRVAELKFSQLYTVSLICQLSTDGLHLCLSLLPPTVTSNSLQTFVQNIRPTTGGKKHNPTNHDFFKAEPQEWAGTAKIGIDWRNIYLSMEMDASY